MRCDRRCDEVAMGRKKPLSPYKGEGLTCA